MSKQPKVDKCAQCGKEISNPILRVRARVMKKDFLGLWIAKQSTNLLYCSKECAITHFAKVCPEV